MLRRLAQKVGMARRTGYLSIHLRCCHATLPAMSCLTVSVYCGNILPGVESGIGARLALTVLFAVQGSPSIQTRTRETYRHSWSVTSYRPGQDGMPYLYTLTLSCPDEQWTDYGPLYEKAMKSFRLVETTQVRLVSISPALDLQA